MFLMRLLNFLIVCMWPIFLLDRAEVDDFPVIQHLFPAQQKSTEAWNLGQQLPGVAIQVTQSSRRKEHECVFGGDAQHISVVSFWSHRLRKSHVHSLFITIIFYPICFTQLPTRGSRRQNLEQTLCLNRRVKKSQNI